MTTEELNAIIAKAEAGDVAAINELTHIYGEVDVSCDKIYQHMVDYYTKNRQYKKLQDFVRHLKAAKLIKKAKKEVEVRALIQKAPDDLTGREVKRLKELQNNPDVDVEDFLTAKEYKKFLSIVGEPKNDDPTGMSLFGHPIQFDKQ